MVNKALSQQLTEDEKKVISKILLGGTSCSKTLFIQLTDLTTQSLLLPPSKELSFAVDPLFEQALVTAMLRIKICLEIRSETMRFSTRDLAESILQDFDDASEKRAALNKVMADIRRYNKHQCRNFFLHTRKNDASFFSLKTDEKNGCRSRICLAHERYILEIEYLLKRVNCKTCDRVQEAVNVTH